MVLEIFVKSPGKLLELFDGRVVRSPIRFYIEEEERIRYQTLFRMKGIVPSDYEIYEVDEEQIIYPPDPDLPELSLKKHIESSGINIKIQNQ